MKEKVCHATTATVPVVRYKDNDSFITKGATFVPGCLRGKPSRPYKNVTRHADMTKTITNKTMCLQRCQMQPSSLAFGDVNREDQVS